MWSVERNTVCVVFIMTLSKSGTLNGTFDTIGEITVECERIFISSDRIIIIG